MRVKLRVEATLGDTRIFEEKILILPDTACSCDDCLDAYAEQFVNQYFQLSWGAQYVHEG